MPNAQLPDCLARKLHVETVGRASSLAVYLVEKSLDPYYSDLPQSIRLAASFDLLVASKYSQYASPEGWVWCKDSNKDFYPNLNACPYCACNGKFVQVEGHKPSSGQIGPATAVAFREIIAAYFLHKEKSCRVYDASEPIDIAVIDEKKKVAFIAEVKAAPLFSPPICRPHTNDSIITKATLPFSHWTGTGKGLHKAKCSFFIPSNGGAFEIALPEGVIGEGSAIDHELANALRKAESNGRHLLKKYFNAWAEMWNAYCEKDSSTNLFWFCGGCGLPSDPGEGWGRDSSGKPKGSISDGKTSVGIDRTDDIKKATFQSLTMGIDNRCQNLMGWKLFTGLASNLHAAHHYDRYLKPYENIVWGWKCPGGEQQDLYNLFDGIISFTKCTVKNNILASFFDWEVK